MNKTQWIAVGGLVVVAALVLVLVLRNPPAPALPPDIEHVWNGTDACLECHDFDAGAPRSTNHPVGRDCMRCHAKAP